MEVTTPDTYGYLFGAYTAILLLLVLFVFRIGRGYARLSAQLAKIDCERENNGK